MKKHWRSRKQGSTTLHHIEVAGCIVNITEGLRDRHSREVTSIEVIPDDYSGERPWFVDGKVRTNVVRLKNMPRDRGYYLEWGSTTEGSSFGPNRLLKPGGGMVYSTMKLALERAMETVQRMTGAHGGNRGVYVNIHRRSDNCMVRRVVWDNGPKIEGGK